MAITITCQKCLHVGTVPPEFAGKAVACPKCQTRIAVPAPQSIPSQPGAVAAPGTTPPVDDEPADNEPWFYSFSETFAYLWMVAVFYGAGVVFSAAFLLIIVDTGRSFRASAGRAIKRPRSF
jgi:hypothetical protein